MSPGEILAEWRDCQSLSQIEIDWLLHQGISHMALVRPLALVTDSVVFHGVRFEFSRYSRGDAMGKALIFPGLDEFGDLVDLVAWFPKAGFIGSWVGRVGLLGQEQVHAPRLGEPLMVYPDPLAWLQAERSGAVVVDAKRAAPLLRQAEPIAAISVEHGQRLRKLLAIRPTRVVVAVREAA